jgi:hypothetical protein
VGRSDLKRLQYRSYRPAEKVINLRVATSVSSRVPSGATDTIARAVLSDATQAWFATRIGLDPCPIFYHLLPAAFDAPATFAHCFLDPHRVRKRQEYQARQRSTSPLFLLISVPSALR